MNKKICGLIYSITISSVCGLQGMIKNIELFGPISSAFPRSIIKTYATQALTEETLFTKQEVKNKQDFFSSIYTKVIPIRKTGCLGEEMSDVAAGGDVVMGTKHGVVFVTTSKGSEPFFGAAHLVATNVDGTVLATTDGKNFEKIDLENAESECSLTPEDVDGTFPFGKIMGIAVGPEETLFVLSREEKKNGWIHVVDMSTGDHYRTFPSYSHATEIAYYPCKSELNTQGLMAIVCEGGWLIVTKVGKTKNLNDEEQLNISQSSLLFHHFWGETIEKSLFVNGFLYVLTKHDNTGKCTINSVSIQDLLKFDKQVKKE